MEKEVWKVGKNGGCIVSSTKPERVRYSEHDFESEKEYYGGYLIAESIPDNNKAKLLAAAPDLLEALTNLVEWMDDYYKDPSQTELPDMDEAKQAIKKATE